MERIHRGCTRREIILSPGCSRWNVPLLCLSIRGIIGERVELLLLLRMCLHSDGQTIRRDGLGCGQGLLEVVREERSLRQSLWDVEQVVLERLLLLLLLLCLSLEVVLHLVQRTAKRRQVVMARRVIWRSGKSNCESHFRGFRGSTNK